MCKHKWEVKSEATLPSGAEVAAKAQIMMWEKLQETGLAPTEFTYSDYPTKHICILACEKCGKLERFIT